MGSSVAGVAKFTMAFKPELTVLLLLFAWAFVGVSVKFLAVAFVASSGCSKLVTFFTWVQVFTSRVTAESSLVVQAFFFSMLILPLV